MNTEDEKPERVVPEIKSIRPIQHGGRRPGAGRKTAPGLRIHTETMPLRPA